jgi:hypothetical protein
MEEKITTFHKRSRMLWTAILSAVIVLSVVAYVLNRNSVFQAIPESYTINQVLFIAAIIFAAAIILFKRSTFVASKIVERLGNEPGDQIDHLFSTLQRNYLIVWSMGEAICLVGFVNYTMTADFNSYLIFAVVSAYSLLINIPQEGLIYKCLELMDESR